MFFSLLAIGIFSIFGKEAASAASSPSVLTSPAFHITYSSATLYAGVDPKTASSLVWFEYGTESGVYPDKTSPKTINDPAIVSNYINSLSPNTVYHFRAVAKNIAGTSYGKELSFQTNIAPPSPPVVSSSSSSSNSSSYSSSSSVSAFSSSVSSNSSSKPSSIPGASSSASISSTYSSSQQASVSSLSSSSVSFSSSVSSVSLPSQPSPPALTFSRNLSRGTIGEDVRALQTFLAQDKSLYPEGLITGTYGPLTEKAVKRLQAKYNLPQVGEVGPLTRMILQTAQTTTSLPSSKVLKPSPISGFNKKISMPIKKQSSVLESLTKKGIPAPLSNGLSAKNNYRPTQGQIKLSESQSPLLSLNFNLNLNGANGEVPTKSDGAITFYGLDGNGVDLNSKSNLTYSATPDNLNKDSGTFELWFRPYTWAVDSQVIHRLFDARFECQTEGCFNYMVLDIDNLNKKIIFKINDYQAPWDWSVGEKQAVYNFNDISQWQWHHLAVSWDKQTGSKMYFDGKKVAENNQPFNLGNPYGDIVFSTSELNDWVGSMSPGSYVDFLNIYGYPKTENEILSDYNTLKDPVFTFKTDDTALDFKITGKMLDKFVSHQDANVAGQDGGVSIPYNGKSLWIFGDTLLKNGGFVNNNIALSAKDVGFINTDLNYKKDAQGNAAPILLPQAGEDLIWAGQMFNYNGTIYTYYLTIKMDEKVWFYALGEGWAKSTAPITDINKAEFIRTGAYWPAYEKTSITDGPGFPVYDDGKEYIYMSNTHYNFTADTQIKAGAFMTRVKKSEAENLTAHEYWNGTAWTKDKNQKVNIFPAPYNENIAGSVIGWNSYLQKYLMIHSAGPLVNLIAARVADNITGPWSEAKILVDCDKDLNDLFPCYVATYHPEYDKDNGQTIRISTANGQRYYLYGLEARLEKVKEESAKPDVIIKMNSGQTYSAQKLIERFSFGNYNSKLKSFSLSDEGLYSRKKWDIPAYGIQGHLIADKLLSFGSNKDIREIRNNLLAAPVDTDGMVDSTVQARAHLGIKTNIESNLEYILMAKSFLAHSGDKKIFYAPNSRLMCYVSEKGLLMPVEPNGKFDCGKNPFSANNESFYEEGIHNEIINVNDNESSPARAIGQIFTIKENFSKLKLALSNTIMLSQNPIRIVIVDQTTLKIIFDKVFSNQKILDGWFDVDLGAVYKAGQYNIEIFPTYSAKIHPFDSYWYSVKWLSETGHHLTGGASTKIYFGDPFKKPAKVWTLGEKIEYAMDWILQKSKRPNGSFGVFVSPYASTRGVEKSDVNSSTYYDLLKSGYKDAYVNGLYLQALDGYNFLQQYGVVKNKFNNKLLSNVSADFIKQFKVNSDRYVSWVGCDSVLSNKTNCDDFSSADSNQKFYDVGFVPSQALIAALNIDNNWKKNSFTAVRNQARLSPGIFKTNINSYETVTPKIWEGEKTWSIKNAEYADYNANQTGDWHMFKNNLGNGNFGHNEENGGILLSTTSFIFEAGPYPEMINDFIEVAKELDAIADSLENKSFNPFSFSELKRKPLNDNLVKNLCLKARKELQGEKKDDFGNTICDFYKSVSFNLPESGSFVFSFIKGLLDLEFTPSGDVLSYGKKLDNNPQLILESQFENFPKDLQSIDIKNLNVGGKKISLTCKTIAQSLHCNTY